MKKAVRAIIIRDDEIVVMHRNKFGKEYYTLPGGGVDMGEATEAALWREVAEETGIQIATPRLVYVEDAGEPYGIQYVYLCKYVTGEPELAADSEEAHINKLGQNLYQPGWLKLEQLVTVPFVSELLRDHLVADIAAGSWPADTIAIGDDY